jgi:hypothetical protein
MQASLNKWDELTHETHHASLALLFCMCLSDDLFRKVPASHIQPLDRALSRCRKTCYPWEEELKQEHEGVCKAWGASLEVREGGCNC